MTSDVSMNFWESQRRNPLPVISLSLTFICIFFLVFPSERFYEDDFFRVVISGIGLLVVPGYLFQKAFAIDEEDNIATFAMSFYYSMTWGCAFALLLFTCGGNMHHWSLLMLTLSFALGLWTLLGWRESQTLDISKSETLSVFFFVVLGVLMYRWADTPWEVSGEMALHMSYVRIYAELKVFVFSDANIRPGDLATANLFFLWEFLLAGVSKVSGLDPVITFLRSRWLIPVLGYASLYLLSKSVFGTKERAFQTLFIAFIANVSTFSWLVPHDVSPFRAVGALFGSIHHSDTAMEILLPIQAALLFRYFWNPIHRNLLHVILVLVLGFFWHPREYFQTMWYGYCLFPSMVLTAIAFRDRMRPHINALFRLLVSFIVLAGVLLLFVHFHSPHNEERQGEMGRMSQESDTLFNELSRPGSWFEADELFKFSMNEIGIGRDDKQVMVQMMLFFVVLFSCLLLLKRDYRTTTICVFFFLLWWMTMCHYLSQRFLQAFTYSEVLTGKLRFVLLFGMVLLGPGWFDLLTSIMKKWKKPSLKLLPACLLGLLLGLFFYYTLSADAPEYVWTRRVLTLVLWLGFGILLWTFFSKVQRQKLEPSWPLVPGAVAFLVFVFPFSQEKFLDFAKNTLFEQRSPGYVYANDNPFSLSQKSIDFVKDWGQERPRITVSPFGNNAICVYGMVTPKPFALSIIKDSAERALAHEDKHPLFNSQFEKGKIDHNKIRRYLDESRTRFIWSPLSYAKGFESLVVRYPQDYRLIYRTEKDMMLEIMF